MITRPNTNKQRMKRHKRVRAKISGTPVCPRLWTRPSKVTAAMWPLPPLLASWLLSVLWPRASRTLFSTAAVTCITAVCRLWLRAPAKAA